MEKVGDVKLQNKTSYKMTVQCLSSLTGFCQTYTCSYLNNFLFQIIEIYDNGVDILAVDMLCTLPYSSEDI